MFFLFLRKQLQKSKNIYPFFIEKSPPVLNGGGIRSGGKPTSGDGKVIRIINADEQHIKERVLLNLKTSQPFEEVLRDLGNYNFYIVLIIKYVTEAICFFLKFSNWLHLTLKFIEEFLENFAANAKDFN